MTLMPNPRWSLSFVFLASNSVTQFCKQVDTQFSRFVGHSAVCNWNLKGDSHFKWKLYTCCCATQSRRWARAQAHSWFRRAKTPLQKARFQRSSKLEPRRPISSLYLQSDSTCIWPSEVRQKVSWLFSLLLLSSWLLLVIVSCWWLLFVGSDWFRTYFLHAQTCDYVW